METICGCLEVSGLWPKKEWTGQDLNLRSSAREADVLPARLPVQWQVLIFREEFKLSLLLATFSLNAHPKLHRFERFLFLVNCYVEHTQQHLEHLNNQLDNH
jgi:hypothetical protein